MIRDEQGSHNEMQARDGTTGTDPKPVKPASGVVAGLAQLRDYKASWLRADVLAGITVMAYLVPQCLAYASVAGAPPLSSLWVAVVAMVLYALLGTSRQLSVGPEAGVSVMIAAAVGPLAAGNPERWAELSALLAVLVGVACILAWVLRLGFLADLLSRPILIGYMAGVGLVMVVSQLGTLTGETLVATTNVGKLIEVAGRLGEVNPAPVALGLAVTLFLIVLRHFLPLAPGTLMAVIGSGAIVAVAGLSAHGIALVGPVPSGLPSVRLPAVGGADVMALLGSALAVAFVSYSDVALTGRAFAVRTGEEIDANREFLALGVANVAAGLTGGFALSASGSRTAIIDAMRAHTQLAGLVAAASVVLVVLFAPGLVALIPKATLAGIVVYAGLHLVRVGQLRRLASFRSTELGLAMAALVGVLVFDVLAGILVAVGLSVIDLFARVARPPASILGRVPGLAGLHNVEDYPDAQTVPGLVVFRYDAPLCFANATDFRARALAAIDSQPFRVQWFLLNAEAIVELDTTAVEVLGQFARDLVARHVVFAMARVKQDLRAQLVRGDLLDVIDEERFYPTLPVAVEAYDRWRERR
jgi:high affinity sulfate transporter 1